MGRGTGPNSAEIRNSKEKQILKTLLNHAYNSGNNDEYEDLLTFVEPLQWNQKQSIVADSWFLEFVRGDYGPPNEELYNKYITNNKKVKYDPFLIEMMCNHFECSKVQVTEYFELIDKQELKQILEMYGTDKKQIKKVLKWK